MILKKNMILYLLFTKMMPVNGLFILLFSVFPIFLFAQEKLSLDDCYKLSESSYPLSRQFVVEEKVSNLKISNLNTKYYPEISLQGQAQYQSDVTKIPIDPSLLPAGFRQIFNIPEPPKDQYKIGFNINQLIWDGGMISAQKDVETVQGRLNGQNVEVQLYQLRQKINDAYFGVLLLQEKLKSLNVLAADLNEKLRSVRVAVENGALLESNADVLEAETIKIQQNLEDGKAAYRTALNNLGELIGRKIDDNAMLEPPEVNITDYNVGNRPEFKLFNLTKEQIENTKSLSDSKNMPKFSAFVQAMYGKPGLNMFDPNFAPFYIAGIKGSWNVWDWSASSREKEILELQKEAVDIQKDVFIKSLKIGSEKYINDIARLQNQIESDKQIIQLRKKITDQTWNQLINGAITSTEYITEANAEQQASLTMESHKLELIQAKVNYITQMGQNFSDIK